MYALADKRNSNLCASKSVDQFRQLSSTEEPMHGASDLCELFSIVARVFRSESVCVLAHTHAHLLSTLKALFIGASNLVWPLIFGFRMEF